MKRLTVLYDAECNFCIRCVRWLRRQPAYISLEFIPSGSEAVKAKYPHVNLPATATDLVVIDDELRAYYGSKAYIICLYALEDYRELSYRLSSPGLWPYARRAFGLITRNRRNISLLFNGR